VVVVPLTVVNTRTKDEVACASSSIEPLFTLKSVTLSWSGATRATSAATFLLPPFSLQKEKSRIVAIVQVAGINLAPVYRPPPHHNE
jgi:hypothetical protein